MDIFTKNILNVLLFTIMLVFVGCGGNSDSSTSDQLQLGGSASSISAQPQLDVNSNLSTSTQPQLGTQIDRVGRAAISTGLMDTFTADSATKDTGKNRYNKATQADWPSFSADFQVSLAILDSLDTNCGNQLRVNNDDTNGRYAALANVLADDQLYVRSTNGQCGVYLGIEAEAIGAIPVDAGNCGGRTPIDNVIERTYSVLAAGILTGIDDGITIDNDCDQSSTVFPFLCFVN